MKGDLIQKIKSRGYWRINFQPLIYTQKLLNLGKCKEVVEKSMLGLRGWNYPHFPLGYKNEGIDHAENFIQGWVDEGIHKEFWRMYLSGQFLHYLALCEDWIEEDDLVKSFYPENLPEPGSSIDIVGGIIYQITEIYEFLKRLCVIGIYNEGVKLSIILFNTKNRKLVINKPGRVPFSRVYTTVSDKIEYSKKFYTQQILEHSEELALETIVYIFDKFGWYEPPIESIKKDQKDLLLGKL